MFDLILEISVSFLASFFFFMILPLMFVFLVSTVILYFSRGCSYANVIIVVIKLEMPSYNFGSTYYEFCFALFNMRYP